MRLIFRALAAQEENWWPVLREPAAPVAWFGGAACSALARRFCSALERRICSCENRAGGRSAPVVLGTRYSVDLQLRKVHEYHRAPEPELAASTSRLSSSPRGYHELNAYNRL